MAIDPARLSARVREVLRGQPGVSGTRDEARPLDELAPAPREIRLVLDDDAVRPPDAADGCVVLERAYAPHVSHGRQTVGEYARALGDHIGALGVLSAQREALTGSRARAARDPLLFFDLETTGLSGGVGTVAFLVGCGWFDGDSFLTHQYFLSGFDAERDMLEALAALTGRFGGLVTFNGRTFDVPLIEMRYAYHRLPSPFTDLPHVDMLPPARRLWRRRDPGPVEGEWALEPPGTETRSCALKSLEEAVLHTGRVGDVPGFEIPGLYFSYLRSGNLEPLETVFEHNRLDLLSLAALTAHASRLAGEGPDAVPSPTEALAMGQVFERAGRAGDAAACYARAGGVADGPWHPDGIDTGIRTEALRRLALLRRRQRRHRDAAEAWEVLLGIARDRATIQEARCALAIYHEHRSRDLTSARTFAERALATEHDPERLTALRHRLARLSRKQGQ